MVGKRLAVWITLQEYPPKPLEPLQRAGRPAANLATGGDFDGKTTYGGQYVQKVRRRMQSATNPAERWAERWSGCLGGT
jgi:hypothetical protein